MIEASFVDKFTRVRILRDSIGRIQSIEVKIYKCRFEDANKMVISSTGEEKVSKAVIITYFDVDVLEGDRIVKGEYVYRSGDDKKWKPALMIEKLKGFSKSHSEIYL
jgi:hypothetical protein